MTTVTSSSTHDIALSKSIDALLRTAMESHRWPGLCVGIVRNGTPLYARGFGLTSIISGTPITPFTVFRAGSIAKTITALSIMQLHEQGCLNLDAPANSYLTSYQLRHRDSTAPPVTLRHLLTHTSGIGAIRRHSDLLHPYLKMTARQGQRLPTLPEFYAPALTVEAAPGTKFCYSNHGFATLGQIVADVSGEPYERYVRRHIFTPLGMTHSIVSPGAHVPGPVAHAHARRFGRLTPMDDREIIPGPAGALVSNVKDMMAYLLALLNGRTTEQGAIVQPETLAMMLTPHYQPDRRLPSMGLGFMLDEIEGHRVARHDGGVPWYSSTLLFAPDDELGVIILSNTYDDAVSILAVDLLRHLLTTPCEVPPPRPLQAREKVTMPSNIGGYYAPAPGFFTNLRFWACWGGEATLHVTATHALMRPLLPVGPFRHNLRLYPVDARNPYYLQGIHRGRVIRVVLQHGHHGGSDMLQAGLLFTLYKRRGLRSLHMRLRLLIGALAGSVMMIVTWRRHC